MNEGLTYVYCLVRRDRRPSMRGRRRGLEGSRDLRVVQAGPGWWLIACSVGADEYGQEALERRLADLEWVGQRALEHEAVVEGFLGAQALLPMKMFALFTSDERAIANVRRQRRRISSLLARVEGQVEWGVRLTWDQQAARQAVARAHDPVPPRSGAAFLAGKRDLLQVTRGQLSEARAEAGRLFRELATSATDARRRTTTERAAPGSRLLLDAAFLVPVRAGSRFAASVRRRGRQLQRSGLRVSLTGPWPAYNFI